MIRGRDDDTGTAHWFLSAALVLAVHGGVAVSLVDWVRSMEPADAAPPAILIDLAPLPTAPPTVPTEIPPGPQQVESEPPPPEPEPEKIEEPPPVGTAAVALPPPKPKPRPREKLSQPVRDPPKRPDPTPEPPAPATSAPPSVVAPPAEVAAAPPDGARAFVPSNVLPSFQQRMLAHLERHKRYPAEAQWRRQQGVAYVRFVMDRSGKVLSFRLERSSGHVLLDEEVLQLIRRAQPLPVPPDEIAGATLELIVPVQFYVR